MKKVLLFVSLFTFGASFAQNCSELFISEYVEGSGNDKAIEIYNPTGSSVDLSQYSVARYSNGENFIAAGAQTTLSGTLAPFSTHVLVNGQTVTQGTSPACSPALQALADQLDGVYPAPTYMNGNDAIVLFKGATIVDIFGKTGDAAMAGSQAWSDQFPYDGSAGTWWTKDHSLIRKETVLHGVTTNPSTFIVTTEWDSLPKDTWSNLGMHTCNCLAGIEDVTFGEFEMYPNPAKDFVVIKSVSPFTSVSVVNVIGEQLFENKVAQTKVMELDLSTLKKGIYFVRLKDGNSSYSTKQIVIQ